MQAGNRCRCAKIDRQGGGGIGVDTVDECHALLSCCGIHQIRHEPVHDESLVPGESVVPVRSGFNRFMQRNVLPPAEHDDFGKLENISLIKRPQREAFRLNLYPGGVDACAGDRQGGDPGQNVLFVGVFCDHLAVRGVGGSGDQAEGLGKAVGLESGLGVASDHRNQYDFVDPVRRTKVDSYPFTVEFVIVMAGSISDRPGATAQAVLSQLAQFRVDG